MRVPSWAPRLIVSVVVALAAIACQAAPSPSAPTATPSPAPLSPASPPSPVATWTASPSPIPLSPTALPEPSWEQAPLYGGEVIAVAVHPSDPRTIYAGTNGAGVFVSHDDGQRWTPYRESLPAARITLLAFLGDSLYAAGAQGGLWRLEGGRWAAADEGLPPGYQAASLIGDAERAYVGLSGGHNRESGGLLASDDGRRWRPVDAGLRPEGGSLSAVIALAMDASGRLYAGTERDGCFGSADDGATWQPLNDGLPVRPDGAWRQPVSALLARPGASPLAAVIGGEYYVYGAAWQLVSADHPLLGSSLLALPGQPQTLLSAGGLSGYVYRTDDAGQHWQRLLGPPGQGHIAAVAFHPDAPDALYAAAAPAPGARGSDLGGVYASRDGGQSWELSAQGLAAVGISALAAAGDQLWAGTDHGYLLSGSVDGPWRPAFLRSDPATDLATEAGVVYVAASGLFRLLADETAERIEGPQFVQGLAVAGSSIYAGSAAGRGVYSSQDAGATWSVSRTGLPAYGSGTCPVEDLAVDPRDPQTVWAGMRYGCGVALSLDGGATWSPRGLAGAAAVTALAVAPGGSVVWAGVHLQDRQALLRSGDGGATWEERWSGAAAAQDILLGPTDEEIWLATAGGLWNSQDGGLTWVARDRGLYAADCRALAADTEALWVGTSAGLYRLDADNPPRE